MKILLTGLQRDFDPDALRDRMAKFGHVIGVQTVRDGDPEQPWAIVDMAPDAEALAAYLEAVERYPLGIEVRYEAMDLALMLGDETTARTLAEDMLEAYPADPFALDVMGRTAGAP